MVQKKQLPFLFLIAADYLQWPISINRQPQIYVTFTDTQPLWTESRSS